jgi:hypothetical protein
MLYLKLTMDDVTVRINMDRVDRYGPSEEKGGKTYLETEDSAYIVKETCEQIDDAMVNTHSKLRLKSTDGLNTGWK